MPILSDANRQVAADFSRFSELGFTREDMGGYFSKLPYEGGTVPDEETAFGEMIAGHHLSDGDRMFLKRLLDDCDPR